MAEQLKRYNYTDDGKPYGLHRAIMEEDPDGDYYLASDADARITALESDLGASRCQAGSWEQLYKAKCASEELLEQDRDRHKAALRTAMEELFEAKYVMFAASTHVPCDENVNRIEWHRRYRSVRDGTMKAIGLATALGICNEDGVLPSVLGEVREKSDMLDSTGP